MDLANNFELVTGKLSAVEATLKDTEKRAASAEEQLADQQVVVKRLESTVSDQTKEISVSFYLFNIMVML